MKVHEIMTAHARCVGPDNTLVEAAGLMRELNVGALPVCEDDRIVGMLTDRDLAIRAIANGRDPNSTAVREVMTPGAVHVFADQEVESAARTMQDNEIRRLPVLSRQRRLVGILSLGDMAVSSNPAFSGITLREVSQPAHPNGRERKRDALGRAAGAGRMPRVDLERPGESADGGASATISRDRKSASRAAGGKRKSSRTRTSAQKKQPRKKSSTRSARAGGKPGATTRKSKTRGAR